MQEEKLRMFEARLPRWKMPGLDSHLCFALYAASNHMTRLFVPFLQKLGVTYPQYLFSLCFGSVARRASETSPHCCIWSSALFPRCLKRIESKGLITRQRQATDERRVPYRSNAEGAFRFESGPSRCWGSFTAF